MAQDAMMSFVPDHLIPLLMEGGSVNRGEPMKIEEMMRNQLPNTQAIIDYIVEKCKTRDNKGIKTMMKKLIEEVFDMEGGNVIEPMEIEEMMRNQLPNNQAIIDYIVEKYKTHDNKGIKTVLVKKLSEAVFVMEGGNVIRGEPVEIEEMMRNQLPNIHVIIDDIVEKYKTHDNDGIKTMVKQFREAVFVMEDIFDEYIFYEEQHQSLDPRCCDIAYLIKSMILRHRMKYKYKVFKSKFGKLKSLCANQISLGGNEYAATTETTSYPYFHEAALFMDKADIVGLEAPCDKLIGWLLEEKKELIVVAVVGMAGLGKTTLARKVFSYDYVNQYFRMSPVWITMSKSYSTLELLKKILIETYKNKGMDDHYAQTISEMNLGICINQLRNLLRQDRYVYFFDDVSDTQFWEKIEYPLDDNLCGSRIFITTRNIDVANCCRSSIVHIHEMQPLNLTKSLNLFNKKVFFDLGGNCPPGLEVVCLEIVKKCKGLPLAIVAIAGALSTKERNPHEWNRLSQNLHSEMINSPEISNIKYSFCIDYDDLPPILKRCMLYFAIYPEDYEIKSKRMIRHWIAEGFMNEEPENKWEQTLEKIAERHLYNLITRCLVQTSSVGITGKHKGVHIYDLFSVILREQARDFSFCKFVTDHDWPVVGIMRRLSIATTSNDLVERSESSHVRSLFFFTEEELPEALVNCISTKYKLLKVLDFESAGLHNVPKNLGNLIHLKFLSFRNTKVQSLPHSIGNLVNLETLDVRQTSVNVLPKEVGKLRKLQHLLGNKMSLIHLRRDIGAMESLQTLSEVKIDEDGVELVTELGKLGQLRKLSLIDVRKDHEMALCSSINMMPHLEKLYIEAKSKDAAIDLSSVSYPTMLQKLRLKAKLNKLSEWIPRLENLVELSLSHSYLTDDPLNSLKTLPNLLLLNLSVDSYQGKCLHFEGGFPKLKELGLRYLNNLDSIIVEEGALSSLKELTLINIPCIKEAPSGIHYLEEKLEVLNTHFMQPEFVKSIAPFAKLVKDKQDYQNTTRY